MSGRARGFVQEFGGDVRAEPVLCDAADPAPPGTGEVTAALAIAVRRAVAPGAGHGVAAHAVGGMFLAVGLRDGTGSDVFALGEQCLALPLLEALTLTVGGVDTVASPPDDFGDVPERLTEVAGRIGGLLPGDLVVLAPRSARPNPVRVGAIELWGPRGSTVTILINGG